MCILFIAVDQHPDYPLIIAANRDEFHQRPTTESHFWPTSPSILAGKDMQAGGTWMGLTQNGRLSALTNVRDPQKLLADAISRGELVTNYLTNDMSNHDYLCQLQQGKAKYNGYNLLFGQWHDLWVYNNHIDSVHKLSPGVYGLSNADLNSPWPKINQGVNALRQHCQQTSPLDISALFNILLDQTQSDDSMLPKTGVPIEWERKLSSIFIQSQEYGTRSATVLLIDKSSDVTWHEHSFNAQGKVIHQSQFNFKIDIT